MQKHKVTFEEAATALNGHLSITDEDPDHSISENRYITFGVSEKNRLLVIAHTEEGQLLEL